jgi:hypothetical protein
LKEAKTSEVSSKLDASMTSHHMFVLGDLNFRTKFAEEMPPEKSVKCALELVEKKDYAGLYQFDELHKGIMNGDLLHGFETLPCLFPPSFKVQRETGFVYKQQRTPSYTDRILFKSAEGLGRLLKPLAYEPCVDFITSDHKPIRGAFAIIPNDEIRPLRIKGKLSVTLSEIQGFDLPKADRNGLADPYVMLMWESVNFEVPNMTFADKLRRYYNRYYWPRTNYVSRSLNPHWKEEIIVVEAENPTIPNGALLHVMVVDHDAVGKDDLMCSASFNVSELIPATTQSGKRTLDIDRPLIQEGRVSGRIKLKLDVEISSRGSNRGSVSLFAPSRFFPFLDPSKTGSGLVDDNVESEQLPMPPPPDFQFSKTL